ncbi:hypothetical protein KVH27_19420 [Streptomyces olivaceus]|uniref:hypothetical protein n=1 Tax=Streptomyces olivaceus TaxID=47716 RepID=UPI001CC9EBE0|nr:hypothetical protein [Streptomyces olivaceus]MBZ6250538.1 hypothetical protein [Streptomyces olivaceus]
MTSPLCGAPHHDHPDTLCTQPAGHYRRDRDPHGGPLIIDGRERGSAAWDEPQETPMADRHTVDTITSDALDALYEQLAAAEAGEAQRQLATAREALASATTRAARAEAALVRVYHVAAVIQAGAPWTASHAETAARIRAATGPVTLCQAGSTAPNALGNERCTLPAGHTGRHADGNLTWPAPAATEATEPDPFSYEERERTGRNSGLRFTVAPRDPAAERAAEERAREMADQHETTARVFAGLHRSAEDTVTRVIDLHQRWRKCNRRGDGRIQSRWWEARLAELHNAIQPADQTTEK